MLHDVHTNRSVAVGLGERDGVPGTNKVFVSESFPEISAAVHVRRDSCLVLVLRITVTRGCYCSMAAYPSWGLFVYK